MKHTTILATGLAAFAAATSWASETDIKAVVRADQPGHQIPDTLYGIFFEDINYAADGGIYAELIANRGFDWPTPTLQAWAKDYRGGGTARITRQSGFPLHPNTAQYLRIEVIHPGKDKAGVGVSNSGFGGIVLKQGATYDLKFYARPHRNYQGGLTVALESNTGERLASFRLNPEDWKSTQPSQSDRSPLDPDALANWVKYTAELKPAASVEDAKLVVLCDAMGTLDLEFVSLFPRDTYKQRRNGLRPDLVELLKAMKPGSLRFPGGCIVEGTDLANLYDWKRTVGPVERRPVNANLWGYWQSGGLGFFEYFQLAEDIGATPLPILASGLSCQFRKSEMIPLDALDQVIQDALDLIEFANGAPDTRWGKVRAEMGRPEPFNMRMLGIGNENWGMEFIDRYEIIYKGIKAKHPEIEIVSSSGAGPSGPEYDLAWDKIPKIGADWIDEHYYVPADWLFNNTGRYDNFNRKGPKVYVGEYACHLPNRANSLYAALAEAAMMTGFERNSDIVGMTAYAPLFSKIGSTQWVPDLIWFTNDKSYGTPSYHVQKLFGVNRPSVLLPTEVQVADAVLPPAGGIGVQTWSGSAEFKDIRVTRGAETLYTFDPARGLEGWSKPAEGNWEVVDGALRQTNTEVNRTAISVGSSGWQDYTVRLKARKLSGQEGFIVRVRDEGNRFVHVNFGGWSNTLHGIEQNGSNPLTRKPGTIETGRWYDVEVSLSGDRVSASLDGVKLFDNFAVPTPNAPKIEFVSGYDRTTGEIVLKVVNPRPEASAVNFTLQGARMAAGPARRILLAGDPDAINDLQNPDRISPVEDRIQLPGNVFRLDLPASSLTILRCKAALAQ